MDVGVKRERKKWGPRRKVARADVIHANRKLGPLKVRNEEST